MCPNIINFDNVDFSERRPEEVMFLLTLSVDVYFRFSRSFSTFFFISKSSFLTSVPSQEGWNVCQSRLHHFLSDLSLVNQIQHLSIQFRHI